MTLGDCFEVHGRYIMDSSMRNDRELILVHAEVAGQGPLKGITYGHAFILDGDTVIDKSNGRDISWPKAVYYALGSIDRIGNIYEYTWPEAQKMIIEHKHWGPWQLATEF